MIIEKESSQICDSGKEAERSELMGSKYDIDVMF